MTQIATVERILRGGKAEVSVPRKSACGHDCESCSGCGMTGSSTYAVALNPIGAQVGQKVVVESSNKRLYGVMLLVYAVPVVLFLIGYFASYAAASEGVRYGIAIAAFCLGIVPAILYDRRIRRMGGLVFTITQTL